MTDRFLLDTCAVIWIVEGKPLTPEAMMTLSRSRTGVCELCVSSMTAWEVGMLISKGRLPTTKVALAWFESAVADIGADIFDASLSVLMASSFLPQPIHNDPTDRILIATAREYDLTIVTRDRAILAYGAAGHVKVLAC
jgi:PIN domain nuclease of toxin-antitoxin system